MKKCWCVLLVEDDPILGPLTFEALNHLGHQAVLAESAGSTYKYLSRQHRFEIVILDLQLGPDRSEPIIQRLRGEGWTLPPILVYSAHPKPELRNSVQQTGAVGFIQKPATIQELEEAVHSACA